MTMSQLLDIPINTLNAKQFHSCKAPKKHNLLASIDPDYISQLVSETGCNDVLKDFYQNIHNLNDVITI